jgi:hypothetical protein
MTKSAFALAVAVALLGSGLARAQTSQQNRMSACNAGAGSRQLAGDARKSFMSDCLSKGPEAMQPAKSAQTSQQQRVADCNAAASAGGMKGDARQSFMSDCLKGGSNGAAAAAGGKQNTCNAQADAKKLAGAARSSFLTKCAAG